jgi:hypothetical protein
MKKYNKINENRCEVSGCGCNVNYLILGVAVIFIVLIVASTVK